jgi:Rrf2 family iron-sulfur cluster assembly transcriptional regulator
MLSLSQTTGYAIQAMAYLDGPDGEPKFIRDVAEATAVPSAYLAKLVQKLVEAGLVESKKGFWGGIRLTRPAREITLLEVSNALDGPRWMGQCLLGLEECSDARACPAHEFWKSARNLIRSKLAETRLSDVAAFEQQKKAPLKKQETVKK